VFKHDLKTDFYILVLFYGSDKKAGKAAGFFE